MENDKIGIFAYGAHGDIALCTSVLKYKDILWPGKDIVWYCNLKHESSPYSDMLKFNDAISEVRDWPEQDGVQIDFRILKNEIGQLRLEQRNNVESIKDLHNGYFPAPWAMLPDNYFNTINYSNIPRIVCGADPSWEWHPYLKFSNEEREMTKEFCSKLPYSKTIMLETQLRSAGDARMSEDLIKNIMRLCRDKWVNCNFIFASKLDYSHLVDDKGVVSASEFTVRQTALIHNHCDLFLGVTSGITMAASCWGNKPVPRIEMTSNTTHSSVIANGPVTSVICENLSLEEKQRRVENAVTDILKKID